jgi:hypothetical protein
MQNTENIVFKNIQKYKRKFYLNLLLRGLIWSLAVLLAVFLVFSFTEHFAYFNRVVRAGLFFAFVLTALAVLYLWVLLPLIRLLTIDRSFSDEKAATQIGASFPAVRDKLLNLLQLHQRDDAKNQLLAASIQQKSSEISFVEFESAISYRTNTRYLQYLIPLLLLFLAALFFLPGLFTESARRIVQYEQDFTPQAPFSFAIQNPDLQAFKNEDFTLQLKFEGDALPQTAYLWLNGRRIKMQQERGGDIFSYTFTKLQESKKLHFEAAGYSSSPYQLKVVERPALQNFQIELAYPEYLQRKNERLSNVGNFQVPEGTQINWQFKTLYTDSLRISFFEKEEDSLLLVNGRQAINYRKQAKSSQDYELKLYNQWSVNKDPIRYHMEVIPDEHPSISLTPYADTTLLSFVVLGGNVADDYGLSRLQLFYRVNRSSTNQEESYRSIRLPLEAQQLKQSYYYRWQLDSLNLRKGDKLEYFVKVWDNDGVNGHKSTQTNLYTLQAPDSRELKESLSKSENKAEADISKSKQQAKQLQEKIRKTEEKLKGKNKINYGDEQRIQDIINERQQLEEQIQKLKEETEALKQQKERFNDKQSEKIKEQAQQLQQLMEEMLDEETKRLYEELEKLMEEKRQSEDFQNVLEQINNKEKNLEKELERALEMFKRLKFDSKLDDAINELEELGKEQEELSEKTGEKESDHEELLQQQEELNQDFKEMEKAMEELQELNQDLKNPNAMDDFKEEQQQIEQQQQESKDALEKGKKKKAQKSQQNAAEQMSKMAQKMQQMQGGMEMEMMQENLDGLRNIVDNLNKISFAQEELMKEFREINQSNPRFVILSQQQLKIQDDAVILEDSLRALAERVFQIRSFVTKEVNEMNKYMEESVDAIKERKKGEATGKQQFAMTSMNNLALLLDDVLQQMQEQMANAMGMPQKGQQNKKGEGKPNLSDLQKQLNERIQQLKQSGKSGRQLSEELARMAAEQEQIRQALKEMEEKYGKKEGGSQPGNEGLQKEMEETETDLVNKRITRELIERQQEILNRLLESENAMREREQDEERKGETATEYEKRLPDAFEEYLRQKEKEVELLKSVPPRLNPYYKKEVNNYFKRLGL